jgi:hypothetical protein
MRNIQPTITASSVSQPTVSKNGKTITVHVPVTFRKQGGRKQIVAPAGSTPWLRPAARTDGTMVKAVVRAHRWRDLLEAGKYSTVRELANTEKINESYVSRVLRLTLLSPAIVQAILEGRQPAWLEIEDLLKPMPFEWPKQIAHWKNF